METSVYVVSATYGGGDAEVFGAALSLPEAKAVAERHRSGVDPATGWGWTEWEEEGLGRECWTREVISTSEPPQLSGCGQSITRVPLTGGDDRPEGLGTSSSFTAPSRPGLFSRTRHGNRWGPWQQEITDIGQDFGAP